MAGGRLAFSMGRSLSPAGRGGAGYSLPHLPAREWHCMLTRNITIFVSHWYTK
jgi:hypothetical protein